MTNKFTICYIDMTGFQVPEWPIYTLATSRAFSEWLVDKPENGWLFNSGPTMETRNKFLQSINEYSALFGAIPAWQKLFDEIHKYLK